MLPGDAGAAVAAPSSTGGFALLDTPCLPIRRPDTTIADADDAKAARRLRESSSSDNPRPLTTSPGSTPTPQEVHR